MAKLDHLPCIEVKSRSAWRNWLLKHHAKSASIWLVTWKKASGKPHVPAADIAEETICFGWIDSLPLKLDDKRSMLLLALRQPNSAWSKINKERAERMIAEGRMRASGLNAVAAAKASGQWSKLDSVEAPAIPDDLAKAFSRNKTAAKFFDAFPRSVKRAILEWIVQTKKPETRARRIDETVTKAARNIRANQWRQ